MPIKVAVVGTGLMGRGIISTLKKIKDIEVVAIADIDLNALERVKPDLPKRALVSGNAIDIFKKKPDVLIEATSTIHGQSSHQIPRSLYHSRGSQKNISLP